MSTAKKQVWVQRPTIARNTSGFTRREIMDALKMAGPKPSGSLLLDLTKSNRAYITGRCRAYPKEWAVWEHNGTEYVADCHIRLHLPTTDPYPYSLWIGRGKRLLVHPSRWQALAMVLAHEIDHWRQSHKDGKVRCLQIRADRAALRVARKLGVVKP
jgi:hypothetical protein